MLCKARKKTKGHTLLELSIVLAIIAIMSGTFLLGARSSPAQDIHNAATLLANDIRYAQQMALQTGLRHRVQINQLNNSYSVLRLEPHILDSYRWQPTYSNKTNVPLYNASFFSVNAPLGILEFTGRGTNATQATTIQLTNDIYHISLTTTVGGGRVYIDNARRIAN